MRWSFVDVMLRNTSGIVGEIDEEDVYIWTHKKLDIGYNGKHIVEVNLTSESKVKLQSDVQLTFTYEVFSVCAQLWCYCICIGNNSVSVCVCLFSLFVSWITWNDAISVESWKAVPLCKE